MKAAYEAAMKKGSKPVEDPEDEEDDIAPSIPSDLSKKFENNPDFEAKDFDEDDDDAF